MKILRLYLRLPPLKGGMEKHIASLTKEQIKDGHNVKIIFNAGEKITESDEKILPFLSLYRTTPQFIGIIIFYIFLLLRLFLKRGQFEIVHIHGDWSSLVFAKFIKKLTNAKKVVFSIHDQITDRFIYKRILPFSIKNVDLIFSTGFDAAERIKKFTNRNVVVQPSGISDIFFKNVSKKFEKTNFEVVTVANLFPKKNISFILELAKQMKDVKFNIIGDGPERSALKNKIIREKIDNVNLLGFRSQDEIFEFYKMADCYLLTSIREGTPTSLLEALACGLPIVSSNVGGVKNIINDYENGFVIDVFDIEEFKDKILLLKDNTDNIRKKIFKNNREKSVNYKWEFVAKRITDLIEAI